MALIKYYIDKNLYALESNPHQVFNAGSSTVISNENTDLCYGRAWYQNGFKVYDILNKNEFSTLKNNIEKLIINIISKLNIDTCGFMLENYHNYVQDKDLHIKIIKQTSDLYFSDLNFSTNNLMKKFNSIFGTDLTVVNYLEKRKYPMILRINRPLSFDFNPPHKDIYGPIDDKKYIPKFVNFWIPIAGVNYNSSLPVVRSSHLLKESKILRTKKGGMINNNNYKVRLIKSWDGQNSLERVNIKKGQVLIFSPHLIHGLAVNQNKNITRFSLEFRLFEK